MKMVRVVVGQLDVNCYVVYDESTSKALIIDPGDEFEKISGVIDNFGLAPEYIFFTHAHYDHVCAAGELKNRYNARIVMHEAERPTYDMTKKQCVIWGYEPEDFPPPDIEVKEGDKIDLGALSFEVLHSAGHTPGGICIYGEKIIFTGDTLFKGSVGRTDLPGGDAEKLLFSLKRISLLPPETRVLCGHGDETTVKQETNSNPFLKTGCRLKLFL